MSSRPNQGVKMEESDSDYWTIILLTPIWYNVKREIESPMVNMEDCTICTLHVTMLSAIRIGMASALQAWIRVGDYLSELLGVEDIFLQPEEHDRFCFYDHTDLSQSKKCFWIINSVDKFYPNIQDTIYQWDWFYTEHFNYLTQEELIIDENAVHRSLRYHRGSIDELQQKLKDQGERFLSIQTQARQLRDGVHYAFL